MAINPDESQLRLYAAFGHENSLLATFVFADSGAGSYYYQRLDAISDYVVQAGDQLRFDIWYDPTNPGTGVFYVDIQNGTETVRLLSVGEDQNGYDLGVNSPELLTGGWHRRKFVLPAGWVGDNIDRYWVGGSNVSTPGTYRARIRNARITTANGLTVRRNIWSLGDGVPTNSFYSESNAGNSITLVVSTPSTYIWNELTSRVASHKSSMGRNHELERDESGSCELTLHNSDRQLEPDNPASDFYPYIHSWVRMRSTSEWDSVTYPVYYGFVQQWTPDWPGGSYGSVDVRLADAFALLSRVELSGDYPVEDEATRINRVLDAANWPAGDRDIDEGLSLMQAETEISTNVMDHINACMEACGGRFYIGPNGYAVYRNRHYSLTGDNATPQVTFNNASEDGYWFESLTPIYDNTRLANHVVVERRGAPDTEVIHESVDSTSVQKHGVEVDLAFRGLLLHNFHEADDMAYYRLQLYKEDTFRFQELLLVPRGSPDVLWPEVLGRQLGDRIRISHIPPGGGDPILEDGFVEGIDHDVVFSEDGYWEATYRITPVGINQTNPGTWILGVSALNVNTVISY